MPITLLMPESANLIKWHKKEGDKVSTGDVLLEIETDKTVLEIEAESDGILQRILVSEGTVAVPADQPLALIAAPGEQLASAAGNAPAQTPAPVNDTTVRPDGRSTSSPLARRLAKEAGIDLTLISGSGPGGRIVERDIRSAVQKLSVAPAQSIQPHRPVGGAITAVPAVSADAVKELFAAGSYEEVALDGMRRTIAERLQPAKQGVPHFYLTVDVELDALTAMRAQINARAPQDNDGGPANKLSINDFVIKALALALQRVPEANAVWAGDRVLRFRQSDVGVAVAVAGGLYTPVLRAVESKTLPVISKETKDLAERARSRRLRPEESRGGSTAVSNLGSYGVKEFSAIINPPHSTILAVGLCGQRVVAKDGAPTVVEAMTVTLSCDHRVIDGALGAQLLGAFKELIERPTSLS